MKLAINEHTDIEFMSFAQSLLASPINGDSSKCGFTTVEIQATNPMNSHVISNYFCYFQLFVPGVRVKK